MAVLTVQDASLSGITPNMQTLASGGDSFPNNGLVLADLNNGAGAPITVTADDLGSPAPSGSLASPFDPNVQISVTNAQRRIWGPFPPWRFNDANGRVNLTYGTNPPTGLTMGLYRIRP